VYEKEHFHLPRGRPRDGRNAETLAVPINGVKLSLALTVRVSLRRAH
jgi:hypothetical protein